MHHKYSLALKNFANPCSRLLTTWSDSLFSEYVYHTVCEMCSTLAQWLKRATLSESLILKDQCSSRNLPIKWQCSLCYQLLFWSQLWQLWSLWRAGTLLQILNKTGEEEDAVCIVQAVPGHWDLASFCCLWFGKITQNNEEKSLKELFYKSKCYKLMVAWKSNP